MKLPEMKFMLDTMVYDELVANPSLVAGLNPLHRAHVVTILSTHIQEDELAGIKDAVKAAEVSKIERELVPTAGGVWGVSRWGVFTWGDGGESGISIDQVRSPSNRHTRDALIATSALKHADVLVTNDKRLAKRLCSLQAKCQVWSSSRFEEWVIAESTRPNK